MPRPDRWPWLLALLATACAGVPVPPPPTAGERDAAAARLLEGFDAPDDDPAWRVGDRVLLSIRIEEPGREALVRLVRATVAEPPVEGGLAWEGGVHEYRDARGTRHVVESRRLGVDVEIHDGRGALLSEGRSDVPERYLREGLHDAMLDLARRASLVRAHGGSERAPPEVLDPFLDSWSRFVRGQVALAHLLTRHPGVEEIRSEIVRVTVDTPSFWSMLFSRPRALRFECGFERTGRGAIRGQPVVDLPVEVSLDDRPVFRYRVFAAPSRPPLQLTAGVLRLEGEHPADARRRFTIELLAARRGPPASGQPAAIPAQSVATTRSGQERGTRPPAR